MSKYFKNNIFFYEDLKGDLNLNMRGSENGKITIASSKKRDMSEKFELIDTKFADGFKVCVSDKEQKGTPFATFKGYMKSKCQFCVTKDLIGTVTLDMDVVRKNDVDKA